MKNILFRDEKLCSYQAKQQKKIDDRLWYAYVSSWWLGMEFPSSNDMLLQENYNWGGGRGLQLASNILTSPAYCTTSKPAMVLAK